MYISGLTNFDSSIPAHLQIQKGNYYDGSYYAGIVIYQNDQQVINGIRQFASQAEAINAVDGCIGFGTSEYPKTYFICDWTLYSDGEVAYIYNVMINESIKNIEMSPNIKTYLSVTDSLFYDNKYVNRVLNNNTLTTLQVSQQKQITGLLSGLKIYGELQNAKLILKHINFSNYEGGAILIEIADVSSGELVDVCSFFTALTLNSSGIIVLKSNTKAYFIKEAFLELNCRFTTNYLNDVINITSYSETLFDNFGIRQESIVYDNSLSNLAGKKVLFIGDSITDTGYYVDRFQKLTGCIVYNRGVAGTRISNGYGDSFCERMDLPANEGTGPESKALGFPANPDLIIVFGGINDWGQNKSQPFGEFTDAIDRFTFVGGLKYLYKGLKLKYPGKPIVIINILHCMSSVYSDCSELSYVNNDETNEIIISTNNVGKTYYDYHNAISYIASLYGLPVIDMWNVGFTPINSADNTEFFIDGLHPNVKGGNRMGDFLYEQLKTLGIRI